MAERAIIPGLFPSTPKLFNQYQKLWAIPTYGNNPWIDSLSYNSKIVNKNTDVWDSLNVNLNRLGHHVEPVKIRVYFAGKQDQIEGIKTANWSKQSIKLIKSVMGEWQNVANIRFPITSSMHNADFIYYTSDDLDQIAYHESPSKTNSNLTNTDRKHEAQYAGFNKSYLDAIKYNKKKGSEANHALIHEIGHGIGLKHPHDRGSASEDFSIFPGLTPNNAEGDKFASMGYGLNSMNQSVFTAMSYNQGLRFGPYQSLLPRPSKQSGHVNSPMALDIMSAQIKYGYNLNHNSKDTTYKLPTSNDTNNLETFWRCIWDTDGEDTLDGSRAKSTVLINLKPAPLNAYVPEHESMQESFKVPKQGPDRDLIILINKILTHIAPEGALLGSGISFVNTAKQVAEWVESKNNGIFHLDDGLNFIDYFEEALKNFESLSEALKYFSEKRDELANAEPEFNLLYSRMQKQQDSDIQISSKNAGGYISHQIGIQGGLTIAAGTIIENAIGGAGNDLLIGHGGDNHLIGNKGHDFLEGKAGNDSIQGGLGDDLLFGNSGIDTLIGGQGKDIFVVPVHLLSSNNTSETDLIKDFDIKQDAIGFLDLYKGYNTPFLSKPSPKIQLVKTQDSHQIEKEYNKTNNPPNGSWHILIGNKKNILKSSKSAGGLFEFAINTNNNTLNYLNPSTDESPEFLPIFHLGDDLRAADLTSENFVTGINAPSDVLYETVPS